MNSVRSLGVKTAKSLFKANSLSKMTSPAVCNYHADYEVPDFSAYRHKENSDPSQRSSDNTEARNAYTYMMAAGLGTVGILGAQKTVGFFLATLGPSSSTLALGKVEVNLNDIPEGKNVTLMFRGKPHFVRHRTQKEIDIERKVDVSRLRHPETDDERIKDAEWLVVVAVCTHLGCVPMSHSGEFGGYYCPCHGSHYDVSGRIRIGPAPRNLDIPPYTFPSEGLLLLGGEE